VGILTWLLLPVIRKIQWVGNVYIWIGFIAWIVFGLAFMEVFTTFPGTHIWVYILPLCIFIGFIFSVIDEMLPKLLKVLYYPLIFVLFMFLTAQSYAIFVDHESEYPWGKETFLYWKLNPPDTSYQLSLFGFPYRRR
jgi:hypothetical protein